MEDLAYTFENEYKGWSVEHGDKVICTKDVVLPAKMEKVLDVLDKEWRINLEETLQRDLTALASKKYKEISGADAIPYFDKDTDLDKLTDFAFDGRYKSYEEVKESAVKVFTKVTLSFEEDDGNIYLDVKIRNKKLKVNIDTAAGSGVPSTSGSYSAIIRALVGQVHESILYV